MCSFDNVEHSRLIRNLQSIINDQQMIAMIKRWLDASTVNRGLLKKARGIPQGSVLSPFLCNVYLTPWDNDMAAKNLPFIRFSDDFLIFTDMKDKAVKAQKYVEKRLKRIGLSLNHEKSRVQHIGPNVKFLGQKLPQIKQKSFT